MEEFGSLCAGVCASVFLFTAFSALKADQVVQQETEVLCLSYLFHQMHAILSGAPLSYCPLPCPSWLRLLRKESPATISTSSLPMTHPTWSNH